MRLWSLAPALLDRAALIACWREGLLAQKVLAGLTKGYTKHPQLLRFRAHPEPMAAIAFFLGDVQREATARGYNFNPALINRPSESEVEGGGWGEQLRIPVTEGQLAYELEWLRTKVRKRDPAWLAVLGEAKLEIAAGATFVIVPGDIEEWERVTAPLEATPKREVKTKATTSPSKRVTTVLETRRRSTRITRATFATAGI